jgi:hypothetical protein
VGQADDIEVVGHWDVVVIGKADGALDAP